MHRPETHILIPVKELRLAKQRLSSWLSPVQRSEFSLTMFRDVLSAAAAIGASVWVTGTDSEVLNLARKFGATPIPDREGTHNEAIESASRICAGDGAEAVLVLAADVPLVTPRELERMMPCASLPGCVLVRSRDGGTNAILRAPTDLFPARFGPGSFARHQALAQAAGVAAHVPELPGVTFDIDRPSDLKELLLAPGQTHSQQLLRSWEQDLHLTMIPVSSFGEAGSPAS